MLTEKEKEGCKQILMKLNQQDLITLTDTVTNRVISPENMKGELKLSLVSVNVCSWLAINTGKSNYFPEYSVSNTNQTVISN